MYDEPMTDQEWEAKLAQEKHNDVVRLLVGIIIIVWVIAQAL